MTATRNPSVRNTLLILFSLAIVAACLALLPTPAWAQEAVADSAAQHAEPVHTKSQLMWFIESSGWIGAVLLVLSMYFIALVSRLFFQMRVDKEMPDGLVAETNALVEQRDFKGAYDMLKGDDSMYGKVSSAALEGMNGGQEEAHAILERVADAETIEMEKKISMLAVLGTLGPMIGLLGTLKGMIASFSVIATSDVQLKASEVAGGISEALLLTFEGVALSVPAIYFYAVFRNRVAAISSTVLMESERFLRHVAHIGRNGRQAAAAGAARPRA